MTIRSSKFRVVLALSLVAAIALSIGLAATNRVDAHTRITTDVNWSGSIRSIFIQKCMPCHHPGGLAPDYVDLTMYGTDTVPGARAWAAQIEDEIMLGRMPPWNADERFGSFSNTRGLTKDEKALIISWIRGGGPQGPLRNIPPPAEFARPDWTLGQPDVVVALPQGHVVPANQRYDSVEATLAVVIEKDTYITGYEFLVGDPQNVSRVSAWLLDPEGFEPQPIEMEVTGEYDPYAPEAEREKTRLRAMPRGPHFLGQWVKGDGPVLFPDTAGRKLYAGSSIQLRVEYARPEWADWTKEIHDSTRLGLFLGAPDEEFDLLVESTRIEAAPFTIGAETKASQQVECTFEENVHLLGLEPHLGPVTTQLKAELFYPDGISRTLVWVPRYQHRWVTSYRFESPVAAPKGARLVVSGHFDNTKDNPENPNSPPIDVKTGPGYLDERLYANLHYALDDHLKLQPVIVTTEAPQNGGMLGGLGGDVLISAAGASKSVQESTAEVVQSLETSTEPERIRIASNGYQQVRGVMRRPGAFSLYVYNDKMEPIDPRNFAGELMMDGGSRTVPLVYFAPGDEFLSAWLDPIFPQAFEAKLLLGSAEEKFDFRFDAPSPSEASAAEATPKAAFVQAPHGGWLESIEGTGYQVEGALPAKGDLRLYFYGPGMKPVDPRNFHGDVEIVPTTPQTSIKSLVRLAPPSSRAEYLGAKVAPELPLKARVTIAVGKGHREIEFEFDEITEAPWDAADDTAAPPPVILGPRGSPELFASANGFHFIEAALPRPGELRLYFYDSWKNPVDPGLFTGEIESNGVTLALSRQASEDAYLVAYLPPQTPLKANATLWIAGKEEKFKFNFAEVTIDPAALRNVAVAHMDHTPLHGGQFFMADNMFHHVEGTMPVPGELHMYFYDDFRRPIDPRNFSGSARIEHLDEKSGEVTEEVFTLELLRPGDGFLTAKVPAAMPCTLYAQVRLGGVEKRFDFKFDQVTVDIGGSQAMAGMPGGASATGSAMQHLHVRPPFTIPQTLEGILAALDAKQEDLRQRIAAKDGITLYQPGLDIADLVAALTKLDTGVDPRQKGRLKIMLGAVNITVNKMDRAGDTADMPRIQMAFEDLSGQLREIHTLFAVKK